MPLPNESKGTVLVVDDRPNNVRVLMHSLGQHGYTVHAVGNGMDGVAAAKRLAPDVILLDVLLPDIDGYEACELIHAEETLQQVPVIFMSALSETTDKIRGFEAGGIDYLTKPIDTAEAAARVSTHVTLYKQQKEIQQLLVERSQAEDAERHQRMIVSAMLDSAIALNSTLRSDEVFERILTNLESIVRHDLAILVRMEGNTAQIISVQVQGDTKWIIPEQHVAISRLGDLQTMLTGRKFLVVADYFAENIRFGVLQHPEMHSSVSVPILIDNRVFGFLCLMAKAKNFFDEGTAKQLGAFAVHAAIAVKNAQYYAEGQELAAVQERQRIARDLHDSLSQTLFSVNAIVESLPLTAKRTPDILLKRFNELRNLSVGAMAEMRSLLIELRPDALTTTPIHLLMRQLADAFTGISHVPVDLNVSETILPVEMQIAFYRIAQEALNNIAKHAQAKHITLTLIYSAIDVELTIIDDGVGFDFEPTRSGHFGLEIMLERAQSIGGELIVISKVGSGTTIRLRGNFYDH